MIIIADDDQLFDRDLKSLMEVEGFDDVRTAETCELLLTLVRTVGHPEGIILDMMLPRDEKDYNGGLPPNEPEKLRGLDVLNALKKMNYDLRRIVVITAFYNDLANELLRNMGILEDNILIKPAYTRDILSRIRTVLRVPGD